MKAQKKLNLVLIILIIFLISVISFAGIYQKNKNDMSNILPSYVSGNDLKGYRQVILTVSKNESDGENEVNSNETESSNTSTINEANEAAETNETSETNSEEDLNAGNYKKSAEIIRKRLKSLEVDNYTVTCDENTGRIVVQLPEDDKTDTILSDLTEKGKFSIVDSTTGEELLTNDDVKIVYVGVRQDTSSNEPQMYMSIRFNNKGTSKFKNITKNYQNTTENDANTENESTNSAENEATDGNIANESSENSTTESDENMAENSTTDENSSEDSSDKKVTLKIDDADLMTTDFSEVIDNGVLSLTLGNSSDSDDQDKMNSVLNLAAIIENASLPIDYTVESNTYVASVMDSNNLKILIYAEIGIALVVALILVIKYRLTGVLSVIFSIGYVALLLIVIRYANVTISINGIIGVLMAYLVNSCFSVLFGKNYKNNLSKKDKDRVLKNIAKKYATISVPLLLIAIVCCFTSWAPIFSSGMIMFWGIIISWIYNFILAKILL